MDFEISEKPERWVIVWIGDSDYKVYGTWAGGYLGSDRWKINSGIEGVEEDEDYYYFLGYSGSCYKCDKKGYGVVTSYGVGVLDKMKENGVVVEEDRDWIDFFKEVNI